jgi:hypothetical protein
MGSVWKNELTLATSKDHLFHFKTQYFQITSIIQIFFLFHFAYREENYDILLYPSIFIIIKLRLTLKILSYWKLYVIFIVLYD